MIRVRSSVVVNIVLVLSMALSLGLLVLALELILSQNKYHLDTYSQDQVVMVNNEQDSQKSEGYVGQSTALATKVKTSNNRQLDHDFLINSYAKLFKQSGALSALALPMYADYVEVNLGKSLKTLQVQLYRTSHNMATMPQLKLLEGSFPTVQQFDQGKELLSISNHTAKRWFPSVSAIGKKVVIKSNFIEEVRRSYTVVAVFEDLTGDLAQLHPYTLKFNNKQDYQTVAGFIPYNVYKNVDKHKNTEMYSDSNESAYLWQAKPGQGQQLKQQLTQFAQNNFGDAVTVRSLAQDFAQQSLKASAIDTTIALFAAIGLFICAITLTNMAYARMAEQKRSVALRKSLGAHTWQVFWLYLRQNTISVCVAGVAGLALTLPLHRLGNRWGIINIAENENWWRAACIATCCTLVCTLFVVPPVWEAANKRIVAAKSKGE